MPTPIAQPAEQAASIQSGVDAIKANADAIRDLDTHDCAKRLTLHHGRTYVALELGHGHYEQQYICSRCGAIW